MKQILVIQRASVKLLLVWLIWAIGILAFQGIISARLSIALPDRVLFWTESATNGTRSSPDLEAPFLGNQIGWDSEYYLSIAQNGYDDPLMRTIPAQSGTPPELNRPLSLNYAFFPVYPHGMRWLAQPLMLLGFPVNQAIPLAGVIISLLGTLAGCFALYDLAHSSLGAAGAMRSIFYLLIFPTGFFLAQVYTEGLFIGLAWGSLALLRRKQWIWAGILAAIATLTRAVGVLLLIPLLWDGWQTLQPLQWRNRFNSRRQAIRAMRSSSPVGVIGMGMVLLAPLLVHLVWRLSFWGRAFQLVQTHFFRCEALAIGRSGSAWGEAIASLWGNHPQTSAYYAIELSLILLGLIASVALLRHDPPIALFSAAVILVSMTCGLTWSVSRYLLTVPALFLMLGRWGNCPLFDRLWTVISVLLLGLGTTLFTLGAWAG